MDNDKLLLMNNWLNVKVNACCALRIWLHLNYKNSRVKYAPLQHQLLCPPFSVACIFAYRMIII